MKKFLKTSLMLMLMAVGIILTACGYSYKDIKISASYSGEENGYLSLTVGDEATINFTVSNLPTGANPALSYSKDSNVISSPTVVSVNKSTGENVITIKALASGNATLRAIADGGNYYELNIKATLAVTDFVLKDSASLFAVRGTNYPKNLKLDYSFFDFTPADTTQKEIVFKDANDNVLTEINANDYPTDNEVAIYATSPYLSKRLEIKVTIIDEISAVNAYEKLSLQDKILTSEEQATDEVPQTDILFISNRSDLSRKVLKVVAENNVNPLLRVTREVISQNLLQCSQFDVLKTYQENGNTVFEFELQSLQEGETLIKFNVYYLGYESYQIVRSFNVVIKNAPDKLLMNDIEESNNVTQILYDGAYSTVYSTLYLSVIPTNSIYDRIEVSYDLSNLTDVQDPIMSDYISFTVGGANLTDTITDFTSPIIAKGIKSTSGKEIFLVVRLYWGEQYNIENEDYLEYRLAFVVKTGANSLLISEKYNSAKGIYIESSSPSQTFNGLYVSNISAATENLTIIPISQGASLYAKVEENETQPVENETKYIPLTITPLSVGTGKWRVMLPNGVYRDLVINVITQVNSLALSYDEYNSSSTSTRKYDENNSLTEIGVKLSKISNPTTLMTYSGYLQLTFNTDPANYNFTNTNLFTFDKKSINPQGSTVSFNNATNVLSFQTTLNGFGYEIFEYTLLVKKVSDFNLISKEDLQIGTQEYDDFLKNNVFTGSLKVNAYVPLTSVNFSQKEISLYSEDDLGINYKDLSKANVRLTYSPNEIASLFDDISLSPSALSNIKMILTSSIDYTVEGNILYITNYGSYDFETGIFTLNMTTTIYEPFYIYASVTYYNELYTTSLKVTPKYYQSVTGVRLSKTLTPFTDEKTGNVGWKIYLDPTHPYQDIYTYVVPENAVHKDLQYTFEPDIGCSTLLVKIENTYNGGMRVVYNSEYANIGQGGSGYLVISPMASIQDPSKTPSNALKIRVVVGDGSINNPFMITTAEELMNIKSSGLDKHYVIENVIDMSNVNFKPLGVFTGSINGLGVGKIIGLNINTLSVDTENNYAYAGLFEKLAPKTDDNGNIIENTGVIKNLIIEGSIDLTADIACSVGLVCGEIEIGATLQNVTAILNQSAIIVMTKNEIKVGGVTGENLGTIVNYIGVNPDTNIKYKNYSSIIMNSTFTLSYALQTLQTRSFFGGIAGVNDGIIKRVTASNVKLYSYDNYSAIVNMVVCGLATVANTSENLCFSIGAFAGKNASIIKAERYVISDGFDNVTYYDYIKASGNITCAQVSYNRLGGLVGENLGSLASLSHGVMRVLLSAKGTGNTGAYVGGLFGYNDQGQVKNCVIQALEDGKSLGTNASLIFSSTFGVTQDQTPVLDGKVNIYGYDKDYGSISLEESGNTTSFTTANSLSSETYIGGTGAGKRTLVSTTTYGTLNNYYGDFLVGNLGYSFKSADATLVVNADNTINKMTSENSTINMAYMFYYKAEDSDKQGFISSYNIYELPFEVSGEIGLYSFDTNIISIGNDGKLTVRSTGLVKIRILSLLNAKISQDVYIFAVSATNGFSLYVQSLTDENMINSGKVIKIYSDETALLIVEYYNDDIELNGYTISLSHGQNYILYNEYADNLQKTADLVKIGSMYGLEAVNGKGNTTFKLYAKLVLTFNGETYTSGNLKNALGNEVYSYFVVTHITGATNIQTSLDEISVEPMDNFNFNIITSTDDFEESVTLSDTKLVNNEIISGKYFDYFETNRIYTISLSSSFPEEYYNAALNGQLKLKITQINLADSTEKNAELSLSFDKVNGFIKLTSSSQYSNKISLDMSSYFTATSKSGYTYKFNIELNDTEMTYNSDGLIEGTTINSYITLNTIQYFYTSNFVKNITENYAGTYYINFAASTQEVYSAITVNVVSQSVSEITVDSFEGSTKTDINSGKEQSDYIDPQSDNPNHFRISVYPVYADYDYIEIVNTSNVNALLTLIDENEVNKFGAILITNGIRLAKSNISNYNYVKYAVGATEVANGQILTFAINAYKNGNLIYSASKNIVVKFTKDVTFTINGKIVKDNIVYLTRGSTYTFDITSNGYVEDNIYISSSREDIISVNKEARTITITSNNIVYASNNMTATIQSYGSKTINGEVVSSSPYVLNVVVVDYYLIPTTESTIVKNGSNGIVSIGLGNTYTLQTELLNGLTVEYCSSLSTIAQSITTFQNSLNTQSTWQYQIGTLNQDGTYSYSSDWTNIISEVSSSLTNGYFTIVKTNGLFIFTPLKVVNSLNAPYKFRIVYGYDYQNGLAVYNSEINVTKQEFIFNVYQVSSMDTPTPIYTAEDLTKMQTGVYYILMNNITLPSTFTPITTAIGGFDGNGFKFIISNNYTFTSIYNVGVFGVVAENELIRNLTIQITTAVRISVEQLTTTSVYFGLLAGENNGSITNCMINTLSGASVRVVFTGDQTQAVNYVGGLVGINNGYITNCRAILNLTASANLSGLVSYNTGKISSSYVDNSLIINTSTVSTNKTAGLVVYNTTASNTNGRIINCYVSGLHTGTNSYTIYANSTTKIIRSSAETAGFIYQNEGIIADSYSNIPISTSSKSAGFAFINKGTISNSYSTSLLKSNSQESYGFVYDNSQGTLSYNYYLTDTDVNYSINTTNANMDISKLKPLTKLQFQDASNFASFCMTSVSEPTKGTWFMPSANYIGQFGNMTKMFIIGRPEIVSANLIATSYQTIDFDRTTTDSTTGETTYYYKNSGAYSQGSLNNPYIIVSAFELENRILSSNGSNLNTNNYRIVCDIDYTNESIASSRLYNTVIIGDIEGNGMLISGYVIDSSVSTTSAGLFAKVGNGSSQQGTIKDLILNPKYVNMPNASVVGGLAGTLDAGTIFNITLNGFAFSNSGIVIIGKNIVGGIVGRAVNNYKIFNVSSSVSTNATYRSPLVLGEDYQNTDKIGSYFLYRSHTVATLSKLSYSGSVAGVLAGTGTISYVKASGVIASMAEFASLVFGGVGDGVSVTQVNLTLVQGQFVQAAVYGGLVAGEFYGRMSYATVNGNNTITGLFKTTPFVPYAVGGLVGLMGSTANLSTGSEGKLGGRIQNSSVTASFIVDKINIVGGLVGELIGGRLASYATDSQVDDFTTSIKQCKFIGSIQGGEVVGGIIGRVSSSPKATIKLLSLTLRDGFTTTNTKGSTTYSYILADQTSVTGGTLTVNNSMIGTVSIGGIVGKIKINGNPNFVISNSYSSNEVIVKSDIYGSTFGVYAGGLVGNIHNDSQTELEATMVINTSYFSSRIALYLRDLKNNVDNAIISNSTVYIIHYGKIIANFEENFTVSGAGLFYKKNTTTYTGNIQTDENDYMLFMYTTGGKLVSFDQGNDARILFNQTVISSQVEGLPSLQTGFAGYDFTRIWIINTAGTLPVLRF